MIKNLLNTGTVFDYSANDKNFSDDLLDLDISPSINIENETSAEKTFEDED